MRGAERQRHAARWLLLAATAAFLAGLVAAVLALHGYSEDGLMMVIRGTARTSVALFTLSIAATGLHAVLASRPTGWLRDGRHDLFVCFALSHIVHGAAIAARAVLMERPPESATWVTAVGGGLGYAFILGIAATSLAEPPRWQARPWSRRLRSVGLYLLWLIFLQSYGLRALQDPWFFALAALLVAGMGFRVMGGLRLRGQAAR